MRIALRFASRSLACLVASFITCLLVQRPALAAETHEILLGTNDRYQIAETAERSFEVTRESSGRFADVKIKPKSGDGFSLTLYFLADTPDIAKLDSPEKIAASVTAGAERYLPLTVEKKVTLQAVAPRRSYGSITVLTAASLQGLPGEYKYQTRGMVRLSPDAALGFSLLSKEINTANYRQLLNYVYGFVKMTPTTTARTPAAVAAPVPVARPAPVPRVRPQPAPTVTPAPAQTPAVASVADPTAVPASVPRTTAEPVVPPMPERAPPSRPGPVTERAVQPTTPPTTPSVQPSRPAQRGSTRDVRDCANLPTNAEVMRCVSGGK